MRRNVRVGWLTLALSGEAAVVSTKPAGNTIGGHHGEPDSGLVRFNALLNAIRLRRIEAQARSDAPVVA
jgi:hypothetical protein